MLYVLILNCLFSKYYSTCFSIVNRFSAFILKKNVPRHILAPSAVACDILHLRASAHPQRSAILYAIYCIQNRTSYDDWPRAT